MGYDEFTHTHEYNKKKNYEEELEVCVHNRPNISM